MYKRAIRTLATLLIAVPLTGLAASGERPDYSKADADGNGQVAVSEATKAGVPKSEAKREDIDNDGKLTKADWKFVDMNPSSQSESGSS